MTIQKAELVKLLKSRKDLSFVFSSPMIFGETFISDEMAADILLKSRSHIDVAAEISEVSVEHLKEWHKWVSSHCRCTGKTKRGTQCRNDTMEKDYTEPKVFVSGKSDRCKFHQE